MAAELGSRLVFQALDAQGRRKLWALQGEGGVAVPLEIADGPEYLSPGRRLAAVGGRALFVADDGVHGNEVWSTDGTLEGTRMLRDFCPSSCGANTELFWPVSVPGFRGFAFVAAEGAQGPWQLWRSDGTQNGTVRLTGFSRAAGNLGPLLFSEVKQAGRKLFFSARDGSYGLELWVSEIARGSARLATNVNPDDETPPSPLALVSARTEPAAATGTCQPGPRRLCLQDGRFAVEASWKDFFGNVGHGTAVPLTADTGWFWFFDAANVEVVLKVLDGTDLNGKHWVFYGALSNVEYTLTVTDTQTGAVKEYRNPSGRFASVADTAAF